MIHCLVNETEPRFGFICMTGDQYPQLLAFTYLNELRSQFLMYLSKNWKELDRNATVRCKPFCTTWCHLTYLSTVEMNTFARQIQQTSQQYTSSHYDLRVLVRYLLDESLSDPNFRCFRSGVNWMKLFLQSLWMRSLWVIKSRFLSFGICTILPFCFMVPFSAPSILYLILRVAPSRKTTSFFFSHFLTKHPFLTIGLFIMLAVLVFLYFVVIVPLCGSHLEVCSIMLHNPACNL